MKPRELCWPQYGFSPKHGFILLLLSLVGLLILPPYWQGQNKDLVTGTLLTAVMLSFLLLVVKKPWELVTASLLAIPAFSYNWGLFIPADSGAALTLSLLNILFYGFVIIELIRLIARSTVIDFNIIAAAICAYFMLGLAWAFIYVSIETHTAGSFTLASTEPFSQLFYFSFVTMTTLGYGDILPNSTIAKHWVVLQAITGQFYLAVIIARLVGLYKVAKP
jgi:hypothetical protein